MVKKWAPRGAFCLFTASGAEARSGDRRGSGTPSARPSPPPLRRRRRRQGSPEDARGGGPPGPAVLGARRGRQPRR